MRWVVIIVGGLAGILLLAVAVLAALGFRPGAGRVAGTIEVARAPADVWPWIVEGERQKEWVGWLTEVHDLNPGVEGVGARYKWVMIDPTMNNQRVEIDGEVTAHEPGRLSTARLDSPGMFSGHATYELTDLGGARTRVEYVSEFRMQNGLWRLLEPVVTPQARRKAVDDLERMKERIESETGEGG